MNKRPRRNHTPAFKARVALAERGFRMTDGDVKKYHVFVSDEKQWKPSPEWTA